MVTEPLLRVQTITDPVERAVARLRAFEPPEGYYWLAFSGGKDSQCIYHLAQEAGVRFEAHYNATTVDPPELVRFLRAQYPGVTVDKPTKNMKQLIASQSIPPTRLARYCCRHLKERGGEGRLVVTGVRWAESRQRRARRGVLEVGFNTGEVMLFNDNEADRRMVEHCPTKGKQVVNPIIDWSEQDVWHYLTDRGLPHCSLYDEGFSRLGCVGCPMGGRTQQRQQLARWPHFRRYYLDAFALMLERRRRRGLPMPWQTAEDVMAWWLQEPEYPLFDA